MANTLALVRFVTIYQDEGGTFKDCHDSLQNRYGEKFHEIKPMLDKAWKEGTEELKIQDKSAFVNKFKSTMGSSHKDSLHNTPINLQLSHLEDSRMANSLLIGHQK